MAAWKRTTRIDRSCCGGIITGRFVSLLIKKYQQDKKSNSFEVSLTVKVHNNNQLYRSLAGNQLWSCGRQDWIFSRIGDQEGAISDPETQDLILTSVSCVFWDAISIFEKPALFNIHHMKGLYMYLWVIVSGLIFRERPLPAIHIKQRNLSKSPPLLTKLDTSPCHKHKSFRKTFTKATSKIFSRKSVAAKAANNSNAAADPASQNAVSGTGTRNESSGTCVILYYFFRFLFSTILFHLPWFTKLPWNTVVLEIVYERLAT